jgi:hypothetical protein
LMTPENRGDPACLAQTPCSTTCPSRCDSSGRVWQTNGVLSKRTFVGDLGSGANRWGALSSRARNAEAVSSRHACSRNSLDEPLNLSPVATHPAEHPRAMARRGNERSRDASWPPSPGNARRPLIGARAVHWDAMHSRLELPVADAWPAVGGQHRWTVYEGPRVGRVMEHQQIRARVSRTHGREWRCRGSAVVVSRRPEPKRRTLERRRCRPGACAEDVHRIFQEGPRCSMVPASSRLGSVGAVHG